MQKFLLKFKRFTHLAVVLSCAVAIGGVLRPTAAVAAVPGLSVLEGSLTGAGGTPVADGVYALKVALYKDAQTLQPLWNETINATVKSGQFAIALGASAPLTPTAINGATLVGITVGSDPELPKVALQSALFAARSAAAEAVACSGCISVNHLDAGLQAQSTTISKLSDVAKSGLYSDLIGAPDPNAYAKKADVKAVVTSGSIADLTDLPTLPVIGKSCGSGLVLAGFKADGSLDCVAGGAATLAKDAVAAASNNLIFNTFVDKTVGKTDILIPDGLGAGVTDTLNFPSIGIAQKIWVEMSLQNSDISGVKIELYGPGMLNPYVLYQGGKTGQSLTAKFNDDTPLVSGDMTKDFVGKDITGNWSLTVKDLKVGGGVGGFDGKFNWSVNIQTLSSKKIQIKGDLIIDGDLTVGSNTGSGKPVYWSGAFSTYSYGSGTWYANNDKAMTGGVAPSDWGSAKATASMMSDDFDTLRGIFSERRAMSSNSNVCSEIWRYNSDKQTRICGALFRVANTTNADINWPLQFYYTAYQGWSQVASVSINGAATWVSSGDVWPHQSANVTVTVPKGKVSTIIVMSNSSPGYGANQRNNFLAFFGGTLKLPTGLSYVDDLESVKGPWKQ